MSVPRITAVDNQSLRVYVCPALPVRVEAVARVTDQPDTVDYDVSACLAVEPELAVCGCSAVIRVAEVIEFVAVACEITKNKVGDVDAADGACVSERTCIVSSHDCGTFHALATEE